MGLAGPARDGSVASRRSRAVGLLLAGLAFIPLAIAAQQAGATGAMASVWWLVLAYLVLELGEMCLSPVGLSAVTQLSVPRVVSLMMGTWFLATAFSETLAALFGKLAAIEIPEGDDAGHRRCRRQVRAPVLADDVDRDWLRGAGVRWSRRCCGG